MKKDLPFIIIVTLVLLVGCTMPTTNNGNGGNDLSPAEQTEVALTVDAATGSDGGESSDATATSKIIEASTHTPGSVLEWSPNDKAKFITDVNYPDNSTFEPDVSFTKKWRIQNVGETTWTTEYKLVFVSGELMGAPSSISLHKQVAPGETIDLAVDFTSPSTPGTYRSDWLLVNDKDEKFGMAPDYQETIWTIIKVVEPGGSTGSSGGPGIPGGATISTVTITANPISYSGDCPATIVLSGEINTSSSGQVRWTLSLTTSKAGFTFDDPGYYYLDFASAGTKGWQYTLFIYSDVTATAILSAAGDTTVNSAPVNFSVDCQ